MTVRSRHHGFTLSETLAALAVAGIGVTLAAPGLQSLAARNRQATAVNQLVATLHHARSQAILRNRTVAVCASADGEHCDDQHWETGWIAFVDTDGDGTRSPDESLLEQAGSLPGLTLRSAEFAGGVRFMANGRPAGPASGEFTFCEAGATAADRVVILRPTGLPALAGHGRDGSIPGCSTT
ncbi:MAG: GspH/FimT family pseudopilin [Gammaproteobacteria bacterium]|nr:GspH/FimT family pseudopilin [Gammaproteobacteria bacterium]